MKKFFILLIVVIMLTGLTFSSFAAKPDDPQWNGNEYANNQEDGPLRDCLKDGSCIDCPNPDGCVPEGDGPKQKKGKQS